MADSLFHLSFACLVAAVAGQWPPDMNGLLVEDMNFHGPGVKARLTTSGTKYVADVVANAFAAHFADVRIPSPVFKLRNAPSVSLSKVSLTSFRFTPNSSASSTANGLLHYQATNVSIGLSAFGNGFMNGTTLANEEVLLNTVRAQLNVFIRIQKNRNGNPAITLESCAVRTPWANASSRRRLAPGIEQAFLRAAVTEMSEILEKCVCPRISHIFNTRVNQRFALLPSKISLEDTNNFDIVRSIVRAEEKLKRIARQNRVQSTAVVQVRPNVPLMRSPRRPRDVQAARMARWQAAQQRLMLRPPWMPMIRQKRQQREKFHLILNSFNFSRANALLLDYAMLSSPVLNANGIEIVTSGEVLVSGNSTPFGARPTSLPRTNRATMLQIVVSDFVPNSLMYHGHRIGMFNTRVDWRTPQLGPVMRTSCDLSTGSLFCVGDLFPTLRDMVPNRLVAFLFSTRVAPAMIVRSEQRGGIRFVLQGVIEILTEDERSVGVMDIMIDATMKMRLTSSFVKGRVSVDEIKLTSRTPNTLIQEELDDAGFLSREILQRMVNDILKQGVPIPIHPLFKLVKPKLILGDRTLLLETNFRLNEHIIRQLTAEKLAA